MAVTVGSWSVGLWSMASGNFTISYHDHIYPSGHAATAEDGTDHEYMSSRSSSFIQDRNPHPPYVSSHAADIVDPFSVDPFSIPMFGLLLPPPPRPNHRMTTEKPPNQGRRDPQKGSSLVGGGGSIGIQPRIGGWGRRGSAFHVKETLSAHPGLTFAYELPSHSIADAQSQSTSG